MKRTTNNLCIPNDIAIDILLRLPANSLLRLRWVCKYWFDLITIDPDFIKMHLHRSTHDEIINNNPCVLLSDYHGSLFKRYFSYTTYNASSSMVKLDFPIKCNCRRFQILGYCNGLIFFQSSSPLDDILLCIWNPCTKEYRILPQPFKFFDNHEIVTYGFGYDHTIDDYKVIRNVNRYRFGSVEKINMFQVYTLRANSWRSIEHIPNNIGCLKNVGVFVNGALYWIIDRRLISFDIEKEKYQEVSNEPCIDLFWGKLLVFEGSLCLLTEDMYVMNKETYSWTKVCRISKSAMIKPLRFTENGNILMVGGRPIDLILWNPKKKIFVNFNIFREALNFCRLQEVYTESLVSLNSDT